MELRCTNDNFGRATVQRLIDALHGSLEICIAEFVGAVELGQCVDFKFPEGDVFDSILSNPWPAGENVLSAKRRGGKRSGEKRCGGKRMDVAGQACSRVLIW